MLSPLTVIIVVDQSLLKPAYAHPLPIAASKKGDLLKLSSTGAINNQFHSFYENLPSTSNLRDCLPEPDCTEDIPTEQDA